jgi:transglutaminase-like putative cysteine protease
MADHLDRRGFLRGAAAAAAMCGLRQRAAAQPAASAWRTFDVRVRLTLPAGRARAWVPVPLTRPSVYQRTVDQQWTGNAARMQITTDPSSRAPMLAADWRSHESMPSLELMLKVATRDHRVDPTRPAPAREDAATLRHYLRPTSLIPVDGIVRERATAIVRPHRTPLTRARAIYDWVVDNTFRDPKVQGCGLGDIRWMLESGSLGGKCADLNALFVGLCRSIGLPARDLYGLRVASSRLYASLGRDGDVTAAQHCRAEVHVDGIGWVPVDPADVRKIVLEERPAASLSDPDVQRARELLFGSWEMNWIAFNDAHDVVLPGSGGKPLPFLMYPQAELDGTRRNPLDAATFRYAITSRELQ